MIQSIAVSRHRILRNLIHFCKGMEKAAWSIADTKGKIISHITQSLGYYSCWVGKVKDLYIRRSVFFASSQYFTRAGTERIAKEKPAAPVVSCPKTPDSELLVHPGYAYHPLQHESLL